MAKEKITQPTIEQQRELNKVVLDSVDIVDVRDKKFKVRWLRAEALERMTDVMLKEVKKSKEGQDISTSKIPCKCVALIVLGRFFKIKLFYWFLWRWYYYVREYGTHELFPVVEMAQKKMACQTMEYQFITIYLTALRNTKMMMTQEEAKATQAAPSTASSGK